MRFFSIPRIGNNTNSDNCSILYEYINHRNNYAIKCSQSWNICQVSLITQLIFIKIKLNITIGLRMHWFIVAATPRQKEIWLVNRYNWYLHISAKSFSQQRIRIDFNWKSHHHTSITICTCITIIGSGVFDTLSLSSFLIYSDRRRIILRSINPSIHSLKLSS